MIDFGQPAVHTGTLAHLAPDPRPVRRLDQHLILLVTRGHGASFVDFVRYPCRPGTLLWARPSQVLGLPRQDGLDAILVGWRTGYLPELPIAPDDPFGPACWQLAGEDEDAVIDEVSQLVVDCDRYSAGFPGTSGEEMIRHQLATLILRVSIVPPVNGYRGEPAEVDTYLRFRRAVEAGFTRSHQVATYADELRCSVRTLTRACRSVTGRSAKRVLDDRVVLEAKRLLACTDLPAATIAIRLGFPEPSHFGRVFFRAAGCPPGTFRSRLAPATAPPSADPATAPPSAGPGKPPGESGSAPATGPTELR